MENELYPIMKKSKSKIFQHGTVCIEKNVDYLLSLLQENSITKRCKSRIIAIV